MSTRGNKFVRFLKRNNFYIILIVTVIAFVGAGASLYKVGGDLKDTVAVDQGAEDLTSVSGVNVTKPDTVNSTATPVTKVEADAQTQPVKTDNPTQTPAKEFSMIKPLDGEVIVAYTADTLIYSETMDDYRSHMGIDIKGQLTAPVKAVEDGVVERISTDGAMGITIVINHQNGIKTVYSNLSTDSMVKKDQKVTKGTVISGVGDTAQTEAALPPHLHFEVIKDGKNVNPLDLIQF